MKFLKIFFIIFISINTSLKADSKNNLIQNLKQGGKLIFIRHAYAPGGGDPENFNINDCSTQRNLSKRGQIQAMKIGNFFRENQIEIKQIYSSEWCRCKDTAKYAFNDFKTFDALNSFYDIRFADNKDKQIKDFYEFIDNIDSKNNIVFVTHYVVIGAILNIGTSSGEIVVTDKNLNIIGSIDTL